MTDKMVTLPSLRVTSIQSAEKRIYWSREDILLWLGLCMEEFRDYPGQHEVLQKIRDALRSMKPE